MNRKETREVTMRPATLYLQSCVANQWRATSQQSTLSRLCVLVAHCEELLGMGLCRLKT